MKTSYCMILILLLVYSEAFWVTYQIRQIQAQELRWYAGYYHYGAAQRYSHPGVYGEIYTINAYVPAGAYYLEWVATVLAYYPILYWVQVGYLKLSTHNAPRYYVEKNDSSGHTLIILNASAPSPGSWHSYATGRPYDLPWESSQDPRE
ncbi:hypothetical protein KEJ34_06335 [Candidatus Bathyarchaeota archaeon]|nr:hypothetical protein [Candidatus Bathyarchaeota archaeon]